MNTIIVKTIFGSHLYGTNTIDSDQDFKGIFMPSKEQIYLNKIPKSIQSNTKKNNNNKNSNTDSDYEIYSLNYFIKMACDGETSVLDMLHTPNEFVLIKTKTWDDIVYNKNKFYTKNLTALIGYARRQASKYGIKGSRLNDSKNVLGFCISEKDIYLKLRDCWDQLPNGEHIFKHEASDKNNNIRMYEVCGRKIGETCTISQLYNIVKIFYDNYGERARQAALDIGIDWKAVSHALRAAYQIKDILLYNTIIFPLKEAEFLKTIKMGKLKFSTVQPILDKLMDEVENLSIKSTLPDKVDKTFWDNFIINKIDEYLSTGNM